MPELILVLHNIRSTHNVGSIFRTAEGLGVAQILLSGYTPYPKVPNDARLPHIAEKLEAQIKKTALGAESMVSFEYLEGNVISKLQLLKTKGYRIVGLEQDARSIMLPNYATPDKLVLVLGEEVEGIAAELRSVCDDLVEIPMKGKKESFNVSVAAGIALAHMLL
jgi:23S rRNA (guanosine2251-2'-O)-methyltransferase